jgi:Ni,Fe-hydrogenase III small subunit
MHGDAFLREKNQGRFSGAKELGSDFVNALQGAWSDSDFLLNYSIVDTPGCLALGKDSRRSYDMQEAILYFAEEAAMIIFMFDVNKVEVNQETIDTFVALSPYYDKIKFVLNKAHNARLRDLLRIQGSLLWRIGEVNHKTETPRIYITSFPGTDAHKDAIKALKGKDDQLFELLESEVSWSISTITQLPHAILTQFTAQIDERSHSGLAFAGETCLTIGCYQAWGISSSFCSRH